MLDTTTKKRIDDCRDILVGKLPDPKAQIEQITIGLIYKFMDDMDKEAVDLGGKAKFFSDYTIPDPKDEEKEITVPFSIYRWDRLFDTKVTASEMLRLYSEAIEGMEKNPNIPQLFRDIFNNAYLPYRDPETLKLFLKTIGEFEYTHSEKLGDAFEYLLSVMGSQGDAGQFRTPRHIIDFIVSIVDPSKTDTIMDPACGTAGFLISAFKHIKSKNDGSLTPDQRKKLIQNFVGYDISPDMVRLSLVNLYLHGFSEPHIYEYDTLSNEDRWNDNFDVILANPPFMSPKGGIRPHKKFTIASKRSEVLFVDYIAEHLNPKGRAGIIVPEGIIFQSGRAYKELRKMLVENFLYAVVSLPAGVFNPYSGVKTSILLLDKELAKKSKDILFIKIDNDGYNLGAQRNKVEGGQLEEAITTTKKFKQSILRETAFGNNSIAHLVSKKEIGKNGDYNLNGGGYKIEDQLNLNYALHSLGELCELRLGGTPSKKVPEYWQNGSIKWISNKCIDDFGNITSYTKITEKALQNSSSKIAPKHSTIIVTRVSVGKYAFPKEDIAINQDMTALVPISKKLNPEFLRILAPIIGRQIDQAAQGIGVRGVSLKFMRNLKIPLPPLSIQEEIVKEIDSYQKIIDGAKAVIKNYKPSIEIEADWEVVELGEVAKPEYGFTERAKNKGELRFIRITDIGSDGRLKAKNPKFIKLTKEAKKKLVAKNDVLVARTGATYGKTMIFEEDYKAVFASFLIRLNFNLEKVYPKYYWVFAQSQDYIDQAAKLMTGGGQPQFNGNTIVKIKFPLPSIDTQKGIVAKIEIEEKLANGNIELVQIFEQKIKDRIAKVWEG